MGDWHGRDIPAAVPPDGVTSISVVDKEGVDPVFYRAIGYPVWSVAVCPRRSRNEFTFGGINVPITISGVTIEPGDFVAADESGVLCVPKGAIDRVLELAATIDVQELSLAAQILNGTLSSWDAV